MADRRRHVVSRSQATAAAIGRFVTTSGNRRSSLCNTPSEVRTISVVSVTDSPLPSSKLAFADSAPAVGAPNSRAPALPLNKAATNSPEEPVLGPTSTATRTPPLTEWMPLSPLLEVLSFSPSYTVGVSRPSRSTHVKVAPAQQVATQRVQRDPKVAAMVRAQVHDDPRRALG